ncbi:MAG: outer membrane lipoprotein-sorting protein [Magnetococcales bacterium]|nr:outer membrane lipoprotein-sorting protein [Magnetococcales bacterium]
MHLLPKRWLRVALGLGVWLMAWPLLAADAEEILRGLDDKLHSGSWESFSRIAFELPNGRVNKVTLYVAKQRGRKAVAVVVAPDDLKGRAVLRVGDEVWMHVPGELEVRRSGLMNSLVGGVFNNADLLVGDLHEEYQPALLKEDDEIRQLELKPRFAGSPYARMVLDVDRKNGMPLRLEQYDASGGMIKTIHYRDVQTMDGDHLLPVVMESASGLNARYRSTWQMGQMNSREFPAEAFTREFLPRAGRLLK